MYKAHKALGLFTRNIAFKELSELDNDLSSGTEHIHSTQETAVGGIVETHRFARSIGNTLRTCLRNNKGLEKWLTTKSKNSEAFPQN